MKMASYQYMKSHCGDKTGVISYYLHNGISYTGKMTYLNWINPRCWFSSLNCQRVNFLITSEVLWYLAKYRRLFEWRQGLELIRHHVSLRWRHNDSDGVSNHQPHDCLLNRLFGRISKKISKFRVNGLCAGNSPWTGEFPAQMASNAENVSVWWRHHLLQTSEHQLYRAYIIIEFKASKYKLVSNYFPTKPRMFRPCLYIMSYWY